MIHVFYSNYSWGSAILIGFIVKAIGAEVPCKLEQVIKHQIYWHTINVQFSYKAIIFWSHPEYDICY